MLGFHPVSSESLSTIAQNYEVLVDNASLSLTGQSVSATYIFPVPQTNLFLIGQSPTLGASIPIGVGVLTLTGQAVTTALVFAIPTGILTLTGNAPTLAKEIPVGQGVLTLTGLAPTSDIGIPVAQGSLTITGKDVAVGRGISVPHTTLILTGRAPSASRSDFRSVDNAELLLIGQSISMGLSIGMGGAVTHIMFTGHKPKLRFGKIAIEKKERDTQALISFGIQKTGATWIDVNSRYKQSNKPLLLTNVGAINNSLYNLFNCPTGSRGRIMQPRYGTFIYNLLQEPIDAATANRVRASLIQTIEEWEPRIQLDYARTFVVPDSTRWGYMVQVKYTYVATGEPSVADFFIST